MKDPKDEQALIKAGVRLLKVMAAKDCERAERRYARGDKTAILDAVLACVNAGVLMPEWAKLAFREAYRDVKVNYLHASWDDAFGSPRKKHMKLPAARVRRAKQWKVWVRVTDLRAENPNKDVFPAVADEFNLSVALCKAYFYKADRFAKSSVPHFVEHAKSKAQEARYELSK